jgi:hypothetical protein
MKDVVLYETVPKKIVSYFPNLYFIFYKFSNFMNGEVQQQKKKLLQAPLHCVVLAVGERHGWL